MIKSKLRLFGWAVGLSLALGAVGAVAAQGAPVETRAANPTYSMTIDSSNNGSNNVHWTASTISSLTHSNVTWSTSVTGTTSVTTSTTYAQIGSKSNPATRVELSTTAFAGKRIVSASLTGFCMSNVGPSLTITAGNTEMLSGEALVKTTSTTYPSTTNNVVIPANGVLKFTVNSSAKAAICISAINIEYATPVSGVSLNKASTSLAVGESEDLVATISPNNATNTNVVWSSSDESVASVVGGHVTGLKAGDATITVTSADDNSKKATCEVTVTGSSTPATGVSLDKNSLSLLEGKTGSLVATVAPDGATIKTVTWESNNESVATVSDGTVTAVSPGDAVITVTTIDGGFEANCDVHVTAKSVTAISVAGTSAHKTTFAPGDTLDTSGLVIHANYNNDTSADVETGFTVTEAGHVFTYEEIGSYTVHVTMGGFSASYSVSVSNKIVATQRANDSLQRSDTGITGTSYDDWSITSGFYATYSGNSAGGNSSIQLRSDKSSSGIVAASPTLTLKKILVEWNSNTAADREIDVYGKNSAYTAPTDLYSDSQGTSLGSIVYGTSTELEIEGDYRFIGIRSKSGALYLTSVTFVWESTGEVAPSVVTELGTFITNKMNLNVTKDTGACLGDSGLYLKAKQAYNDLSENAQLLLTTSTSYYGEVDITSKNLEEDPSKILYRYSDIKARYEKWAVYNNDAAPYDGYDEIHTKIHAAGVVFKGVSDNARTPLLVAAFAGVGALAVGGLFFLRKRKEF